MDSDFVVVVSLDRADANAVLDAAQRLWQVRQSNHTLCSLSLPLLPAVHALSYRGKRPAREYNLQHHHQPSVPLHVQGAQLYVVANNSTRPGQALPPAVQAWDAYPDDSPKRTGTAGASRAALAPFLALRQLGPTFKWAFVATSDADTAFFARAAARMVQGLDPEVPYLLTGEASFGCLHPHHTICPEYPGHASGAGQASLQHGFTSTLA
jgi:hypothetical protein